MNEEDQYLERLGVLDRIEEHPDPWMRAMDEAHGTTPDFRFLHRLRHENLGGIWRVNYEHWMRYLEGMHRRGDLSHYSMDMAQMESTEINMRGETFRVPNTPPRMTFHLTYPNGDNVNFDMIHVNENEVDVMIHGFEIGRGIDI